MAVSPVPLSKNFLLTIGNTASIVYGFFAIISLGDLSPRRFYKENIYRITGATSSDELSMDLGSVKFAGEDTLVITLDGVDYTLEWDGGQYSTVDATAVAYLVAQDGNTVSITIKTGSNGRVIAATRTAASARTVASARTAR